MTWSLHASKPALSVGFFMLTDNVLMFSVIVSKATKNNLNQY